MALDCGDEGFFEVEEEAPEVAGLSGFASDDDGGGGAEFGEVCAGAEVFADGGEVHGADFGVVADGFEGLIEVIAHGDVEGVVDGGSVESDEGDGALFVVGDGIEGGHGVWDHPHLNLPPSRGKR